MVQPERFEQAPSQRSRGRVKAESRYPVRDLNSCIDLVRAIRDKGGGTATLAQLAGFMGYSGTNNGAYITRVAAARHFDLIESSGVFVVPTSLANTIIAPERPGEDDRRARVEAFMHVPLYQSLYERYKSGPLPPEMGLRNAMETHYGIPRARTQRAYRTFIESADQAGFFEARGGQRTNLIVPVISPAEVPGDEPEDIPTGEEQEIRSEPSQRVPTELSQETDAIEKLRLALVEKVKEIPAENIEAIREYIKEIKELGQQKGGEGQR